MDSILSFENLELQQVKDLVKGIIEDASKKLMDSFGNTRIIENNNHSNFATEMDYTLAQLFIDKISSFYPNHNIRTEEIEKKGNSDYTWIIDPTDGSKYHAKGLPFFSISVALQKQSSTIFAAVYVPISKESYWATVQEGAFLNNKKIIVSETDRLKDSFVLADIPNRTANAQTLDFALNKFRILVENSYRVRIFGASSIALCYLAAGKVDAYVTLSPGTRITDVAAGKFILEMAGGKFRDVSGPMKPVLIGSNKKVFSELNGVLT